MGDVTLTIGDRRHTVACPDGQEDQLLRLGALLDAKWATAARASGGMNGERTMLFVALMLADALDEAERRPAKIQDEVLLTHIAERLEALATSLEQ
ncbi:Cell division protein ZapA [compost metagenome]|jgi:cell division protein ZapA|uniref:cell division protein ZapA n=1 Tax=Sphingomonas sp. PL20 TaxID=2760712 RepID=UPI001AE98930